MTRSTAARQRARLARTDPSSSRPAPPLRVFIGLTAETDDRWAYQADPLVEQYSAPGRQYFAGFRVQY